MFLTTATPLISCTGEMLSVKQEDPKLSVRTHTWHWSASEGRGEKCQLVPLDSRCQGAIYWRERGTWCAGSGQLHICSR